MDVIGNADIQQMRDTLRAKFASLSESGEFVQHYLDVHSAVDHWKFATDEMFSVIPFHHELNQFKKGRGLKLANFEAALAKGAYAFGYSKENRLLLTAHPYEPGAATGIECMAHFYSDSQTGKMHVDYETSIQYPVSKFKPRLAALGMLTWMNDVTQVDIGVGVDDAYSVAVYSYLDGRVAKVDRFAQGWNGQTQYDFVYDDEKNLDRVMVDSQVWWKAKK